MSEIIIMDANLNKFVEDVRIDLAERTKERDTAHDAMKILAKRIAALEAQNARLTAAGHGLSGCLKILAGNQKSEGIDMALAAWCAALAPPAEVR